MTTNTAPADVLEGLNERIDACIATLISAAPTIDEAAETFQQIQAALTTLANEPDELGDRWERIAGATRFDELEALVQSLATELAGCAGTR
jgi:hypothetical protein